MVGAKGRAAASSPSSVGRRKAATRAALMDAATRLFAQQRQAEVSIQEITDAAGVGFGSFYNHFASKAQLFEAAVEEAFARHGRWLDELLAEEADPAVVFAMSMRLTGRLPRTQPLLAQVVVHSNRRILTSRQGLAPRALRDLKRAVAAGRFEVKDFSVAFACAAGGLLAVMQLAATAPRRQLERQVDQAVFNTLRMFGLARSEAQRILRLPLPLRPLRSR